ncbi:SAM-dependent methyltransferase [Micromonospora sp. R77]|uniref:SAM-dependent methyltransferase n=1 Tax=Micromonospora sp. R77 TaxID=2925836 RepID=UPI001F617CD4|nr:SAM-dependent methyltransferase [Micromonospora sp. R77]MCI4063111.1 SAM-dependent methyltransferase [Micromonospora sp. R77]
MERALYGPDGFFVSGAGPAAHFRTSVHASPVFAAALFRLLSRVDAALDHPARLDVVDVGAGRGELLRALLAAAGSPARSGGGSAVGVSGEPTRSGRSGLIPARAGSPETPTSTAAARPSPAAPAPLADRVRLTAVERAPRPPDLPSEIDWVPDIPAGITGLLLATEWLDNVPLDLARHTPEGWRYLLVDPATGAESVGALVNPEDADWLTRWWPAVDEARGEIGRSRDEAWAGAIGRIERGLALTVDYGHLRDGRPIDGTLTGYRGGRQVPPVPDGSCDVTVHLAVDSVAAAGERVAGCAYSLVTQREALLALGADGGRPPISLAGTDPAGYVRALAAASTVAELTDPAGLGGHWWLRQPVGIDLDALMAR